MRDWVYPVIVWLVAVGLHVTLPVAPKAGYLLRMRMRGTVRLTGWIAICVACAGITLAVVSLFLPSLSASLAEGDVEIVLLGGIVLLAACALFATVWRDVDLVVTDRGIHYLRAFIPWRDVLSVEWNTTQLSIVAARRRLWNAWTGRFVMWTGLWRTSAADREEFLTIARSHAVKTEPHT